ncbi:E3 ubiquitin ligase family protein [Pseudomonas sp. RIT-PI-AD]|uniref:E3 ubiquitin ligase family protein n=1 Tax=Pseudomonas sp. RIT-PI-AD TaxID=3035294 RepID=UPI0021DA1CAC|nr:E3 ubiquitin ligase family protein [Pseudomonas sp. RIT-PI-AD]
MDLQQLAFGLTFGLGGCLGGGWWCLRRLAQARVLLDTPTSKIRSAAQGYVELNGQLLAQPEAIIVAPLSGTPCLWWRFRIEERSGSGKNRQFRVVDMGSSEAWLRLDDGTGECLIDPRGAEIRPATREVWQGDTPRPSARRASNGLFDLLSGGNDYRYIEERFHVGESLYAIGEFRTLGGGGQAFDAEAAQGAVIREWKRDYGDLLKRFDSDGDGQLSEAEWARARLAARLEAEDRQRQAVLAPARNQLGRPAEALPFILSSEAEDSLVGRLRRQALLGAAVCLVGALASAWMLGVYL